MAHFEKRIRTTTRHEYVLPSPANHVEVHKAFAYAYQEYKDNMHTEVSDDAVWIAHSDEEITIYWEENK